MTDIETKILAALGIEPAAYETTKRALDANDIEAAASAMAGSLADVELDACREVGAQPIEYARIAVVLLHVPSPTRGPVSLSELHSGVLR